MIVDEFKENKREKLFFEVEAAADDLMRSSRLGSILNLPNTQPDTPIMMEITIKETRFQMQSSYMLNIRNISHIIKYEQSKSQNKILELITGAVSHEMLTPLNAILNLIPFLHQRATNNLSESEFAQ